MRARGAETFYVYYCFTAGSGSVKNYGLESNAIVSVLCFIAGFGVQLFRRVHLSLYWYLSTKLLASEVLTGVSLRVDFLEVGLEVEDFHVRLYSLDRLVDSLYRDPSRIDSN